MIARAWCLFSIVLGTLCTSAYASDVNAVGGARERLASILPEPGNLVLLAIGVAGLLIGRHGSRSRRRDD